MTSEIRTLQTQLETALGASLTRYTRLFSASPVPYLEVDLTAVKHYAQDQATAGRGTADAYDFADWAPLVHIVDVNEAALRLLEFPDKQAFLTNWTQTLTPPSADTLPVMIAGILQGRDALQTELPIQTRSGRTLVTLLSVSLLPQKDDEKLTALLSFQDITPLRRLEEALRHDVRRYARLFEESHMPIAELNSDSGLRYLLELKAQGVGDLGTYLTDHPESVRTYLERLKLTDANAATLRLLKGADLAALHQHWHEAFAEESYPALIQAFLSLAAGHKSFQSEIPLRTMEGNLIYANMHITRLSATPQGQACSLITFMDVTERRRLEQSLEQELARYRALFEAVPVPVCTFDIRESFRFVAEGAAAGQGPGASPPDFAALAGGGIQRALLQDANSAALALFEAPDLEELKRRSPDIFSPESWPELAQSFMALASGMRVDEREISLRSLAGKSIRAILRINPNNFVIALMSFQDITQRQQDEVALQASEAKLRAVIDNIGIGVAVISPEMRVTSLNRQMRNWFPNTDPDQGPVCFRSFNCPPRSEPCTYCPTIKTLKDGQVHESITSTPVETEVRHYRVVSSPILDNNAQVISAIEMVEDITERQKTEQALRLAHDRIERMVSSIPSILIRLDEYGVIQHWNPQAELTFGISAAAMIGQDFSRCELDWDWKVFGQHLEDLNEFSHTIAVSDLRFRRPDGTEGFLDLILSLIRDGDTLTAEILIMGSETTERKCLENQLLQAQKLESIGQLAAGIAHEINTPTQYVGDNLNFLKETAKPIAGAITLFQTLVTATRAGTVPAELVARCEGVLRDVDLEYSSVEVPKAIHQALEGVERVSTIVRAMKDFAHPGSAEKVSADLNQAVTSTLTVARNEYKYVADLVMNLDPNLPSVPCLIGEFNQVILNLVVNAAHSIGEAIASGREGNGLITVSTRTVDGMAEIRIADTGIGIPAHILPRIFDPFFTTKGVGKGSGQGLAIAHNIIVKKHHGTIHVETKVGEGATFVIKLPLTSDGQVPGTAVPGADSGV
jgi:PAS domain S-box-containing protein